MATSWDAEDPTSSFKYRWEDMSDTEAADPADPADPAAAAADPADPAAAAAALQDRLSAIQRNLTVFIRESERHVVGEKDKIKELQRKISLLKKQSCAQGGSGDNQRKRPEGQSGDNQGKRPEGQSGDNQGKRPEGQSGDSRPQGQSGDSRPQGQSGDSRPQGQSGGSSGNRNHQRREYEDAIADGRVPNYYEILGVPVSASTGDLVSAYRRLSLKLHPDKFKSPNAEALFIEMSDAYRVLSDASQRLIYDQELQAQSGANHQQGQSGANRQQGQSGAKWKWEKWCRDGDECPYKENTCWFNHRHVGQCPYDNGNSRCHEKFCPYNHLAGWAGCRRCKP